MPSCPSYSVSEEEKAQRKPKPALSDAHLSSLDWRSSTEPGPVSGPTALALEEAKHQQTSPSQHEASPMKSDDHGSNQEKQAQESPVDEAHEEGKFVVGWDGDTDPMNPRNMPKIRKWIIIAIMASGALCV